MNESRWFSILILHTIQAKKNILKTINLDTNICISCFFLVALNRLRVDECLCNLRNFLRHASMNLWAVWSNVIISICPINHVCVIWYWYEMWKHTSIGISRYAMHRYDTSMHDFLWMCYMSLCIMNYTYVKD